MYRTHVFSIRAFFMLCSRTTAFSPSCLRAAFSSPRVALELEEAMLRLPMLFEPVSVPQGFAVRADTCTTSHIDAFSYIMHFLD